MTLGPVLLKTQRNEVLQVLTDAGLQRSQFQWDQREYTMGSYVGPAELLIHRGGDYLFEFMFVEGSGHYSRMRPGAQSVETFATPGTWNGQLGILRSWARNVRTQLDAPDLWESAVSWSTLREVPPTFESNSHFTQSELTKVHARLEEIRQQLKQLPTSDELAAHTDTIVDHLHEESRKQGRRDWLFLALGTLVTHLSNYSIDPTRAKEIIEFLIHGMRGLGGG